MLSTSVPEAWTVKPTPLSGASPELGVAVTLSTKRVTGGAFTVTVRVSEPEPASSSVTVTVTV